MTGSPNESVPYTHHLCLHQHFSPNPHDHPPEIEQLWSVAADETCKPVSHALESHSLPPITSSQVIVSLPEYDRDPDTILITPSQHEAPSKYWIKELRTRTLLIVLAPCHENASSLHYWQQTGSKFVVHEISTTLPWKGKARHEKIDSPWNVSIVADGRECLSRVHYFSFICRSCAGEVLSPDLQTKASSLSERPRTTMISWEQWTKLRAFCWTHASSCRTQHSSTSRLQQCKLMCKKVGWPSKGYVAFFRTDIGRSKFQEFFQVDINVSESF